MTAPDLRSLAWAAGAIGFALSGFFDGILLHQVLQWHHLFSLVPGEAWRDVRNQILMDGLFHVLMYVVAAVGLVMLWRARASLERPGASRAMLGGALLGFGLWHIADAVVSHWLLGIHRIRVDVPNPLLYDLAWLALFGILFILAGWRALRRPAPPGGDRRGPAMAATLALLVPAAGSVAARPSFDGETAIALFASPSTAFAAAAAADARVLWFDRASGLMAVAARRPDDLRSLRTHGALFVSRSAAVAGCLAWAKVEETV